MTFIVNIKRSEKNTVMSFFLAGVLLFPLTIFISSTTQATIIPTYVYAQLSSNDDKDPYPSIATSVDTNSVGTIKKNLTQIVKQDSNSNKTTGLESTSNNTIVSSKNQLKNETGFLSNVTNSTANIASISNAAAQGSSGVTADFNGDGYDDLAIGVPFEDEGDSCITNLPITGVTASGNDGNVPQNVLDNNLATRWSSLGIGQFITADLGSAKKICSVDIAWYNGNARQYHFVIATSTDGTIFTNKFSSDSSGTTLNSEKYPIPSTNARYVKVTVNGNTANNWASITELDIFGPSSSQTIFDSGAVNVIYGSSDGLSATALSPGNGRADQRWTQAITAGLEPGDVFGHTLATGDFNKDGISDLAIGVPREDIGTITDAGAVNVIYGSTSGLSTASNQLWTQNTPGIQGRAAAGNWFGYALSTGDFNNDGISDLAIGVPREWVIGDSTESGSVIVIYGTSTGLNATAKASEWLSQYYSEIEPGDWFGATLSTGYFNEDEFSDLAIGVPREDVGTIRDAGEVDVFYGSSAGLNATFGRPDDTWTQNSSDIEDVPDNDDKFGSALATGDFNKDGLSDLAIGVLGEDVGPVGGTITDAGAVNVIYGSTNGLWPLVDFAGTGRTDQIWTQNSPGIEDDAEDGDVFGDALATGDFNKDGFSDLAIGVSAEDLGTVELVGAVNVIHGSSGGLSPSSTSPGNGRTDQIWTQDSLNIEDDAESIDLFGFALAAGDFNKDGISDLAIGVPLEDVGTIGNAGAVNVIYGSLGITVNSGGLSATIPVGGTGRTDQIWTQNSPSIEDDAEASDEFGIFF